MTDFPELIPALQNAMRKISKKKGSFRLFGIFKRADAPSGWDLVVSAPWLQTGQLKALQEFTEMISKELGEDSMVQLARVVTLSGDDPELRALVAAFSIDDGALHLSNSNVFGLDIDEAFILRAVA